MTLKNNILRIAVALVIALAVAGCFKSVVNYTIFSVAVKVQATDKSQYEKAQDLYTYAFYADSTEWCIASYEDACKKILTNKTSGEKREVPDVYGEMNPSEEYQIKMEIDQPMTLMVIVDPENRIYAYRNYELPVNLEFVDTKLYIAAWKPSHSTSGWRIVNEFYQKQ